MAARDGRLVHGRDPRRARRGDRPRGDRCARARAGRGARPRRRRRGRDRPRVRPVGRGRRRRRRRALRRLGSAPLVAGTLRRGGTRGGTATLLALAALVGAALAFVPVLGYLEALALPVLGAAAAPPRAGQLRGPALPCRTSHAQTASS